MSARLTAGNGMDGKSFTLRGARLADAEGIYALIRRHADNLVPRSLANVVENADRFLVAEKDGALVGCACYQVHPEIGAPLEATVEIQSVAVLAPWRRLGIGRALVEGVIERVSAFSPKEIVSLTFAPDFFRALGFTEISKRDIMHKLYTGCINCTKHADPYTCPEIAMARKV